MEYINLAITGLFIGFLVLILSIVAVTVYYMIVSKSHNLAELNDYFDQRPPSVFSQRVNLVIIATIPLLIMVAYIVSNI